LQHCGVDRDAPVSVERGWLVEVSVCIAWTRRIAVSYGSIKWLTL